MPKYVGGYPTRQNTNQQVATGISQALQNFANAYAEGKQREKDRELIEKMNDPNLSDLQRAQLALQLSPQGQKSVMTAMQLYQKLAHEKAIQERHQDELDIRREREERLKGQNSSKDLDRLYKTELKDLQDQINEMHSEKDKKPLREKRTALQKERASNISRLKKGEEPVLDYLTYGKERPIETRRQPIETTNQLGGAPNQNIPGATPGINPYAEGPSFTTNAPQNAASNATALRQQQPQAGNVAPTPTQPQKMRWDPRNPEHQAFASKVYQDTGGDRAKTNQILAEQFER